MLYFASFIQHKKGVCNCKHNWPSQWQTRSTLSSGSAYSGTPL